MWGSAGLHLPSQSLALFHPALAATWRNSKLQHQDVNNDTGIAISISRMTTRLLLESIGIVVVLVLWYFSS